MISAVHIHLLNKNYFDRYFFWFSKKKNNNNNFYLQLDSHLTLPCDFLNLKLSFIMKLHLFEHVF